METESVFNENAKWISAGKKIPAPIFRKNINLTKLPDGAEIRICSCGFFELFINGERVGEDYFKPGWSNFGKLRTPIVDIEVSNYRAYYLTYDIKKYLKKGKNAIVVMLGKGWYMQDDNVMQKIDFYGDTLKFIADISFKYGEKTLRVATDDSFKCYDGFITFTNVYYGEIQDMSLFHGFCDFKENGVWRNAIIEDAPTFELSPCFFPNDRVSRIIVPKLVYDGEYKIFDCGVNVSGFVQLKSAGGDICVEYAENIKENKKELDFESILAYDDKTIHSDKFINTGKNQIVNPYFVWHGFRYFCVKGSIVNAKCFVVHSDTPVSSSFESDDKVLNWYYNAFLRTQLNIMHCGVPSDCPHREKKGYTGDGQLVAETSFLTIDCKTFYRKWIRDILDSQDIHTGFVPYTAPFYGGGGGVGGWSFAIIFVPYQYYLHYGDISVLQECYDPIVKWINCVESFCVDSLVVKTQYKTYNLGDWSTPVKTEIPEPFVNSYFYVKGLETYKEVCKILDKKSDFDIDERIFKIKKAIVDKYYYEKNNGYCNSVQGADVFAVDLGLGNNDMIENIAKKYEAKPVFDTGIFGTELLFKILFKYGYSDIAYKLMSSTDYPSFGYMMNNGATTIWETWNGKCDVIGVNSHDHPMFGASVKYLFTEILGITRKDIAYKKAEVRPKIIKGLNYCKGSITTESGKICVEYNRTEKNITVTVFADKGIDITLNFNNESINKPNGGKIKYVCRI